MKVTRHPVNLERITNVFHRRRKDLEEHLGWAREKATELYSFFLNAKTVYQTGSVLDPDSPVVARALRLAAQAGTALYVFQRIEDPPRPFVLGEGPAVVYTKPAGASCADFLTWIHVFHLCLVTRQRHLSDEVCRVPDDVFRHSDIVGAATENYGFADLLRAVWAQERFSTHPAFVRLEAEYGRLALDDKRKPSYVRLVTLPYLQVLRQFERRDEAGFAAALAEALQGHKEFWSSKKYREEFNGFVSLPLAAAAALAWDRGMRFEMESDYLPASWVHGDLFRGQTQEMRAT